MTQLQIIQTINAVSNKVNEQAQKLDTLIQLLTDKNASNIDYVAMMTDVELPEEEEEVTE